MTIREFDENVTSFGDLLDICYEYNLYECEDIIYYDQLNDCVNEDVYSYARGTNWTKLRDYLDKIDTGYDYYLREGSFDYTPLDDYDFERYKRDVWERMEEDGSFDSDEDEWEDDEDDILAVHITVNELYLNCTAVVADIAAQAAESNARKNDGMDRPLRADEANVQQL